MSKSVLNNLTRARDIPVKDVHVKLLIQGKSGAGKTTLGAMMPKPLVILTEANGLPSILAANPDAIVVRIYDPAAYGKATSYEVLSETMALAATGAFGDDVESVVADSATEIQRVIKEQILREKGVLDSPGYVFTQQDWGLLTERMRRFARMFRDVPYHTMMITLSEENRDEDGAVSAVVPQFEGKKLAGEVAQFFSAVGLAFKRMIKVEGQPDAVAFEVLFQGASKFLVKPCRPLKNIEPADPRDWITRIVDYSSAVVAPAPVVAPGTPDAAPVEPAKDAAPRADAPEPPKEGPAPEVVTTKPETKAGTTKRRTLAT